MKVYNKLVRTKIPQIIQNEGKKVYSCTLDGVNYQKMLKTKLIEEAREFSKAKTKEEMINELADIREVLDTIYEVFDIQEIDVDLAKHKKAQERGDFKSGTYLVCVEE